MMNIVLALFFSIYIIVPIYLYRSKYNYKLQNITFNFITFVIGSLFLYDFAKLYKVSYSVVNKYTIIVCIGIVISVICTIVTYRKFVRSKQDFNFKALENILYNKNIEVISTIILIIGYLFLVFSFYKMGFIPLLTNDINAKYMSGEFRDTYISVAQYFRIALIIIPEATYLICVSKYLKYKKITPQSFVITFLSFIILMLTNRRGIAGIVLVQYIFMILLITRNSRKKTIILILINLFYIAAIIYNPVRLLISTGSINFIDSILNSVPDIADNLALFDRIEKTQIFSYGRTLFGGLIPFKYEWNPANYSLLLLAGSTDVPSGGIRFIEAVYSYSFIGIYGFPFIIAIKGILNGIMIYLNQLMENKNLQDKVTYSVIYSYGLILIPVLLNLDIDSVLTVLLLLGILILSNILKKYFKYE